jgi:hypothetical protein
MATYTGGSEAQENKYKTNLVLLSIVMTSRMCWEEGQEFRTYRQTDVQSAETASFV